MPCVLPVQLTVHVVEVALFWGMLTGLCLAA